MANDLTDKDFAVMTGSQLVNWWNLAVTEAQEAGLTSYRPVSKFSDREVGMKRCSMLASSLRAASSPSTKGDQVSKPAPMAEPTETPGESPAPAATQEDEVAKTATKKKVAPARGKPRTTGKPAKRVDELGRIRQNTKRAEILQLADQNKLTIDQIADKVGVTTQYVNQALYCIWRDAGVGYKVEEDRKVLTLFPGSKTIDDVIVSNNEGE